MTKKSIANLLKQLRKTSSFSANEVVEKLKQYNIDISAKTLYGYESGLSMPNADTFITLCKIYKCENPMDMLGGVSIKPSEIEIIEKFRVLDDHGREIVVTVLNGELKRTQQINQKLRFMTYYQKFKSAGMGKYLFSDIPTNTIEVSHNEMSQRADFVTDVNDDSMEPDFYNGEKVYIKKTKELSVGKIGLFVQGNECFIKEIGTDCLISRNKNYPDVIPANDIQLIGEVIGKVETD